MRSNKTSIWSYLCRKHNFRTEKYTDKKLQRYNKMNYIVVNERKFCTQMSVGIKLQLHKFTSRINSNTYL